MSLFFDADWFDVRLAALGRNRNDLAAAAGMDRGALGEVFTNARSATPAEMSGFAAFLGVDLMEVSLRCGVATREAAPPQDDPSARIDSIEAKLDAIDNWLAELEAGKKRA